MPVHSSMDEDLDHLPCVIIAVMIFGTLVYHPTMDSNINDEDFTSFDDICDWTYLYHDDYGPDYICDVYHNEHVTRSGLDVNTSNNSYHFSKLRIRIMRHSIPTCFGYLLIISNTP